MLTPSLLRLEYSEDGVFEDRATQSVCVNGQPVNAETYYDADRNRLTVSIPATDISKTVTISFSEPPEITDNRMQRMYEVLERAQMSYDLKNEIWKELCKSETGETVNLDRFETEGSIKECLNEFFE